MLRIVTLRKRAGTQPWLTEFDLRRLALAVVEGAAHPVRRLAADHVHRVPEHRRVALVGDVLQHADDLAVAHLVERLAGELEVVALMIDRPRPAVLDDDAALGGGDDVVEADVLLARQERDVRHALELHRVPRLGERAAVRSVTPVSFWIRATCSRVVW